MATTKFRASASWSGEGLYTIATSRGFEVAMDEPQTMGGADKAMTPVEMLLAAMGGCMTVVVASFADSLGVELADVYVDLEGDLDPDGFMGKNPDVRPGFQEVRSTLTIESPSDPAKVEELAKLAIKRCPVKDTLSGVSVVSDYKVETLDL